MGTDDIFKKRREQRKKRQHDIKQPRVNSYLIVTEGACTEPYYFQGIQKLIYEKMGGTVNIVEIPFIDIRGEGRSTCKLIEIADRIVSNAKILYQNIWVVFDKDDFTDFDQAIELANSRGYKVGWSNQSFEYWLYLHFNYSDSALTRNEWNDKLDEIFRQYNLRNGKYQKNCEDIYNIVNSFDGVNTAIKFAKRRMANFNEKKDKPSQYNPGTTVHKLVEELQTYLNE